MSTFTRQEWAEAFLHRIGNSGPHPYLVKYVVGWSMIESSNPHNYALNNLLNTTEGGFGAELMQAFNSVGVKQFPTFEDGVAANAVALIGGPAFFYPTLLDCLRLNHGQPLIDATPEIQKELSTWGTGHAHDIAVLVASGRVRMGEAFVGRHAGEAS